MAPFSFRPLCGLFVFALLCVACNKNRDKISWKKIVKLLAVQTLLAFFLLNTTAATFFFTPIHASIAALQEALLQGTSFVFGYLGGGPAPFVVSGSSQGLFILVFQALPMFALIASLSALAFHWGIAQRVLRGVAVVGRYAISIGHETSAFFGAKLFLGQAEASLVIRPYLATLSRGNLFTVMVMGMSTSAVALFSLYDLLLHDSLGAQTIRFVVTATLLNLFSAALLAELTIPCETQDSEKQTITAPNTFNNALQALISGALEGWGLVWTIAPLLLVAIALFSLTDRIWSGLTGTFLGMPVSLQHLLGYAFSPLMWLMGLAHKDILSAGTLVSMKTLLNEIVAFSSIAKGTTLSRSSLELLIYPLCNFANLSSIALQIGIFQKLSPQHNKDVLSLVPRAFLLSVLSGCFSGALARIVTSCGIL